jgi:hypothetical protein
VNEAALGVWDRPIRDAEEGLDRLRWLLAEGALFAGDRRFEPVEAELYLHGPGHLDPTVHQHPEQGEPGRFYLHRVGRGFKGGSYKGLDLSWGGDGAFGGALIRGLREEDGGIVSGPSLCVDALLAACGMPDCASLHRCVVGRPVYAAGPLRLGVRPTPEPRVPLLTARVGLPMGDGGPARRWAAAALYRMTTYPELPKGRAESLAAMVAAGVSDEEIMARLGVRAATVARVRAGLASG